MHTTQPTTEFLVDRYGTFYKITRRTPKTVTLLEVKKSWTQIGETMAMFPTSEPYSGKEFRRKITEHEGCVFVVINSACYAYPWDGDLVTKPAYD